MNMSYDHLLFIRGTPGCGVCGQGARPSGDGGFIVENSKLKLMQDAGIWRRKDFVIGSFKLKLTSLCGWSCIVVKEAQAQQAPASCLAAT
jgi:hypothetical protein